MTDIVQMSKEGKKFYPQTHAQAVLGLPDFSSFEKASDVQTAIKNALSDVKTQVDNSAVRTNLAIGTGQEYVMGYGIPKTVWQDGYAYEKLPTTISNGEILPQDPHSFFYTLTKGTTYTQTVWLETDAKLINGSGVQITWFAGAEYDEQPAKLANLGENKYKFYSTYTWPGKTDNNVRLFDTKNLFSAFDLSTGTYLKFGKLKLEKGSVATDWCPNPSEIATNNDVQTSIKNALDKANYSTTAEVDSKLANYSTTAKVDSKLANYSTTSEVDKKISTGVGQAKTYAEQTIKGIIGAAPATLDTIGELANAVTKNKDGVQAINEGITKKADKTELANYLKQWTGTQEEYNAISPHDPNTLYMIVAPTTTTTTTTTTKA